jgi:PAS domain S-box-containing protein
MEDPSPEPDWRLIAESIPHVIWMTRPDGSLQFLNRRGAEYIGIGPENAYDWNWVSFVHPDDVERTVSAWRRAAGTGAPFEEEFRLCRADGQYRWQASRAMPVRAADDSIVKWIGTLSDIEDQKQSEDRLLGAQRNAEQERALLETVLQAAPVAFAYLDRAVDSSASTTKGPPCPARRPKT